MPELIPLFPLDLVLLPSETLPLHIFEPRYKEMIAECLHTGHEFGIVHARENRIAQIGCTAAITSVVKTHPDGRMDIITQGRRRFEMLALNHDRSFFQAEVEWLADESDAPADPQTRRRALELQSELLSLAGSTAAEATADPRHLSFSLAGALPLEPNFKQALLQLRSEPERLNALVSYYEALLPRVRQAASRRKVAGGNGHVS